MKGDEKVTVIAKDTKYFVAPLGTTNFFGAEEFHSVPIRPWREGKTLERQGVKLWEVY
jgi:hypothetical protein